MGERWSFTIGVNKNYRALTGKILGFFSWLWIRKIYIFDLQMAKDFNTCLLTCMSLQETALQECTFFFSQR